MKQKTIFFCQNCGVSSSKWMGRCSTCNEWNTFVEEIVERNDTTPEWKKASSNNKKSEPKLISEVENENFNRFLTGNQEFDRVLGGGIVDGSMVLIGGEPGIGKSTLMLQIAIKIASRKILYISGEESLQQIKMRAERIGIISNQCYLLAETNMQDIFNHIADLEPQLVIIDSIQTLQTHLLEATPGSVSQVRECSLQLTKYAKESNVPVFLIGHINKEGNIAGPKILEHMVDTVLLFEGERHHAFRILRTNKNRFGTTSELGIFEMDNEGLKEVINPSDFLLSQNNNISGVAIGATLEGNRPMMIEVQALVSPATYGVPQRSSTGYDLKRFQMIIAVLEKRSGLRLANQDIFLNITGGLRIDDPSIDLAVCIAIFSSYHEIIIENTNCFIGEVGLGGEIRNVNKLEIRLKEANKLGFKKAFYSSKSEENNFQQFKTQRITQLADIFSMILKKEI